MEYSSLNNRNNDAMKAELGEKVYSRIWLHILRILCVVILVAGFSAAGLALGIFKGLINDVPEISMSSLGINNESTFFYYSDGTLCTSLQTAENRVIISIDEMPQSLLDATVAIEDMRFYSHTGIDLEGILRAGVTNITHGGTAQGGSTITQQVIKKLVLTSNQNWKRKFQEWYLALELEYQLTQEYGKERAKRIILETYLNYNFLGNACYGVETASQRYFGKSASELNLAESAMLAGLFQAPSSYDPIVNKDDVSRNRQLTVLEVMLQQGFITQAEYDEAVEDDVFGRVAAYNEKYEEASNERVYSYFVDSAIAQIVKDLKEDLGYTSEAAYNALYYGGLKVYLTQDARIQGILDDYFNAGTHFQPETWYQLEYALTIYDRKDLNITYNYSTIGLYKTKAQAQAAADAFRNKYVDENTRYLDKTTITIEPQYAMTILDYHNGHIVAMVGGRGEKTANLSLNRAADTQRQAGSTFKVMGCYVYAIESGCSPVSISDDTPFVSDTWAPKNWFEKADKCYYGLTTYRRGVAYSMNIVTARAMIKGGIRANFDQAVKMGYTTLRDDGTANSDVVPSLCLGSCSVTNLEQTMAYGTIANGGVYVEPTYYTSIYDLDGNLLLEKKQDTHRVIKATSAFLLCDMMIDTVKSGGSSPTCNFNKKMAIAGKSGTSQDANDYWFIGFTPYYVASIWAGYDYYVYPNTSKQKMASYHKAIWTAVMKQIHATLPNVGSFTKPEGIVTAHVCKVSGKLATDLCEADPRGSQVITEYFDADNLPDEYCDRHCLCMVCTETGLTPSADCPAGCIEARVCIKRTAQEVEDVYEALAFGSEMASIKGTSSWYKDKTLETFSFAMIKDWYYMAPECYREIFVNTATNKTVTSRTVSGKNIITFDVSSDHVCPLHTYIKSKNPPPVTPDPGDDSGEESHSDYLG